VRDVRLRGGVGTIHQYLRAHHTTIGMYAPRGLIILDNPHIANLGPKSASVGALAGAEIYKALGASENISYISDIMDGGHCSWRREFNAPLTAAIQKHLLETGTTAGKIAIRSGVTAPLAIGAIGKRPRCSEAPPLPLGARVALLNAPPRFFGSDLDAEGKDACDSLRDHQKAQGNAIRDRVSDLRRQLRRSTGASTAFASRERLARCSYKTSDTGDLSSSRSSRSGCRRRMSGGNNPPSWWSRTGYWYAPSWTKSQDPQRLEQLSLRPSLATLAPAVRAYNP